MHLKSNSYSTSDTFSSALIIVFQYFYITHRIIFNHPQIPLRLLSKSFSYTHLQPSCTCPLPPSYVLTYPLLTLISSLTYPPSLLSRTTLIAVRSVLSHHSSLTLSLVSLPSNFPSEHSTLTPSDRPEYEYSPDRSLPSLM